MRGRRFGCASVCALALASARAAADTGVVATAPDIAAALAQAIGGGAIPDGVAAARAAIAAGAVPKESLAQLRRVREQIDEGWRAYLRVQVDLARSRLAVARTDAAALVALPGGAELYADASLRLGAVLHHVGEASDARAAIALALALDPDRPIALSEFSPDIVELVESVRTAPAPVARAKIVADPAGALVTVDGRERGAAPLEVELARGQHVAVARAPLSRPAVQAFALDASGATVELALDRDDDAARLAAGAAVGLDETGAQQLADAVIRYAELDQIVVATVDDRRGGPTMIAQRCAGSPARCTAVVEVGFGERAGLPAAAREAWASLQAGGLRYPPSVFARSGAVRPPPRRCELCRSPVVWAGVGAIAVAGAVIALVATSSSKPVPNLGVTGTDWHR